MDRIHIQPHQLRVTNPTSIQQLKDHPLPLRPTPTFIAAFVRWTLDPGPWTLLQRIQNPIHLLHTRHPRQMLRQLRSTHQQRRIRLHQPRLSRPLEPAPNRRQRPRHASLRQPLPQQRTHISPNMPMLHRRHLCRLPQHLRQEFSKPPHLPRISPQRMLRSPPLIPHHRKKSLRQRKKNLLRLP